MARSSAPRARNLALLASGIVVLALVIAVGLYVLTTDDGQIREENQAVLESCRAASGGHVGELSLEAASNAALIATVARQRNLPPRAVTIGLATAMQESGIRNLDYGDRDSLGMFQQRPSQGWGTEEQVRDPVYATGTFFDHLVTVPGYQDMPITVAAQTVQRSAYPDAYAQHEDMARAFASALTGQEPAGLTCILQPAAPGADAGPLAEAVAAAFPGARTAIGTTPDGGASLSVTLPPEQATEAGTWALAHWSVVAARQYGIVEVAAYDRLWRRPDGAWHPSTRQAEPAGTVLISLAPPPATPSPTPA